jgi:GTP-binding protein HflX
VKQADVLVHVIDVANRSWEKQERAVKAVLADIGCADKPIVRVLNKIDLLDPEDAEYLKYEAAATDLTVAVSALKGDGIQDFVAVVEEAMMSLLVPIEVIIPYSKGDELNIVHEQGHVEVVDYREKGTYVRAMVPASVANRLERFNVQPIKLTSKRTEVKKDDLDWVALGRGRHTVV